MINFEAQVDAFDFETSGVEEAFALQPWRVAEDRSWVTSMSVIRHVEGKLQPVRSQLFGRALHVEIKRAVRAFLEEAIAQGRYVVGWSVIFDIAWCVAYGCADLIHQVKWLDGMLMWRHLAVEPEYELDRSKKKSFGLKTAVTEFMPVEFHGYEEDINFHSLDPADLAKLQKYNDRDSVFTWVLARQFWELLNERQRTAVLIESACLSMVAQANHDGLPIDYLATHELSAKLKADAAKKLVSLAPHGVTEVIVRSPTKLGKLMFDDWKLPVLKENVGKKTGKVSRATDKEVLHELAFMDPRCKELREYREALNNDTKFAEAPAAAAEYNGDGNARPQAIVFGTYSGRLTYASKQGRGVNEKQIGFALHQEKRGKDFRAIIGTPPGYGLLEVDAAGQEFRWMAIKSGDPAMLHLCEPGEDAHGFMAAQIVGQDYRELVALVKAEDKDAEQNRYLGKVANLSLQYRTYPKTFRRVARVQYNIPLELPEAQRIHATYKRTYAAVPRYWDSAIRLAKHLGYVETMAGRRVQLVGNWDGSLGWQMESTALNYPIQGTGADQKYLAMRAIKDFLVEIGGRFAWDLHDGIYMWVPLDKLEWAASRIVPMLNNLPYREAWGFTPTIPLPWDCKISRGGWGTLKEFKG